MLYDLCMERHEVARQVFRGGSKPLLPVWVAVDDLLISRRLRRDVKTSYVSYTVRRNRVVAAIHPDPKGQYLEIALAIPDGYLDDSLYDSIHLRWRTLPRAARVTAIDEVGSHLGRLVDTAIEASSTIRPRSNEEFVSIRRRSRQGHSEQ